VTTGYLVKQENSSKQDGQDISQVIENSNYKKVGNISFPFTYVLSVQSTAGSQSFTVDVKEVKLNEGVTKEDFK